MNTLFHLAFPVHDIRLAKEFYQKKLGCQVGRESDKAVIFKLGQHQIVAHQVDEPLPEQSGIYPCHFGLIFLNLDEFHQLIQRLKKHQVRFEYPLKTRFQQTPIEHMSFFIKDPSNNLLEFKYYSHTSAIFSEHSLNQVGETKGTSS